MLTYIVNQSRNPKIVKVNNGSIGPQGLSAYQVALNNDFIGTEEDWLASLVGPQGIQGEIGPEGPIGLTGPEGPQGIQGIQGIQGEIGPQGPQGEPGPQGDEGPSAYEVAVANGFVGTEAAWLASLVEPQGIQGSQGEAGPTGATGPKGELGPQCTPGDSYEAYSVECAIRHS